jgi:hypothetical protein
MKLLKLLTLWPPFEGPVVVSYTDVDGIEITVGDNRLHATAKDMRLHATIDDNKLHVTASDR